MYPSGRMTTPEPKLRSVRRSGIDSKKSRKKSSKKGFPPNGFTCRSISCDEKILTTAGPGLSTATTTGLRRLTSCAQLGNGASNSCRRRKRETAIDEIKDIDRRTFMRNLSD